MENPPYLLNIGAQLGTLLPPNSSTGKIHLSFLEREKTLQWLSESDGNGEVNEEELLQIKKDRIAFAAEPLISSVSSVSVPVLNHEGTILGSVTIVGFKDEIPNSSNDPLSIYLRKKSLQISECFGYRTNH